MKIKVLLICAVIGASLLSITTKKSKKQFEQNFAFIPAGMFELEKQKVSVYSFYMSKTEVTNGEYLAFLKDLKVNGNEKDYLLALPDSSAWSDTTRSWQINSMKEFYFWHPAYANYPVVNVSKQGAELYCNWLTKKMKSTYPNRMFNDFRLPHKAEWIYAAKGGLKKAIYPWGAVTVRNSKGDYLANFAHIGEQNIKKDSLGNFVIANKNEALYDNSHPYSIDVLAPAKSYWANGFGLYNMSGNAAELIANDNIAMGGGWRSPGFNIQVTSQEKFTKPNPMTGFRVVSTYAPESK